MLQEQRRRCCYQIDKGYLVVKLINSCLTFEYSTRQASQMIYYAKFDKFLPQNLEDLFLNLRHLYKYITEEPTRIIKLSQDQLEAVVSKGDRTATFIIKFQKLEDLSQEDIRRRKIFIIREQIRVDKINLSKQLRQFNQVNQQLYNVLVSVQQQYYQTLRAVQILKEKVSEKRVEKALMKSKARIKEEKLLSLRQKEGNCITVDD